MGITFDELNTGGYLIPQTGLLVSISSDYGTNPNERGDNAVDGIWSQAGGYWCSDYAAYPHWINIDLGTARNVNCTIFMKGGTNEYATVYNLSYSNDNLVNIGSWC
jgi:hypothetical protein